MISKNAEIHNLASIHESSVIWDYSIVRENASIGENTSIGRNVYVGPGVRIGSNCKIQNNALLYEPAIIEDGVFIGPGVILTNDLNPRAINPNGSPKGALDWNQVGVVIHSGASIGANSVCIAPVEIGNWSMIGSGSVVNKSVPNYALMTGNPARRIGWVGPAGFKLQEYESGKWKCPRTGQIFNLDSNGLLAPHLI